MFNNLNQDHNKIIQPDGIKIELMEHQKTILYAMLDLEKNGSVEAKNIQHYDGKKDFIINTNIGILADKVGSGKSLMIISLIQQNKKSSIRDIFYHGSKFLCIKCNNDQDSSVDTNLLLIPHKLLIQWEEFFKLSTIKYGKYADAMDEKKISTIDDIKKFEVLIVTCSKLKIFFTNFKKIKWGRVIIDEADTIKFPAQVEINGIFTWFVTATPNGLRYNKRPYFAKIFKEIIPWVFDYLIVKNNNEYVEQSILLPKPKRIIVNCLTPPELDIIKNLIPKNVLSMINAGNTDEAIKFLNCNVGTKDNILKVITNNLLEVIENKQIELEFETKKIFKKESIAENENKIKILKITKCINRLQNRYDSIKKKIYMLNDQYCPICLDEFTKPTLVNCCQNIFCFECITLSQSKNNNCPFCRKMIFQNDFHIIKTDEHKNNITEKKNQIDEKKDKIDILMDIIKKNIDGKIMIFANFSKTFNKIESILNLNKISYSILKGSCKYVNDIISEFDQGKIKVIMLNAKYFGSGMNLQMATDIIIFHRFDKYKEEQVIGRGQRIGRISALNIYYLVHDNEDNNFENLDKFDNMDYYDWLEQDEAS